MFVRRLARCSRPHFRNTASTSCGTETIYALSTPKGKGGIAVVRVSGEQTRMVYQRMVEPKDPKPLHARLKPCRILHSSERDVIDQGMCVFFAGPRSFTTEDTLEFHLHSGSAVISRTLESLAVLPSCRPAKPGEFTRRAFHGGRIDLTQAEGITDLIDAETEEQRALAMCATQGHNFERLEALRSQVIDCLAMVEALIDFGEGEDFEDGLLARARGEVERLVQTLHTYLDDSRRGEIIRSGLRLAIFGSPNAGKSSLFNHLADQDAAIVTPIAGTTRDVLKISIDLQGMPVVILDTAGLRHTVDVVEKIGVEKAKVVLQSADASICVLSLPDLLRTESISTWEVQIDENIRLLLTHNSILLCNKLDLLPPQVNVAELQQRISQLTGCDNIWLASLNSGDGIDTFIYQMGALIKKRFRTPPSEPAPLITRARHRAHLQRAAKFLDGFMQSDIGDIELGAEELRHAGHEIGQVIGTVGLEDVLDEIFRGFCIGK